MDYFPTKKLIQKLLKIKPIESCSFHLAKEVVYINDKRKETNVLHIFPSSNENNFYQSLSLNLSKNKSNVMNKKMNLKHIESVIKFNKKKKIHKKRQCQPLNRQIQLIKII